MNRIYLGYKQRVVDMNVAIHKRRLNYILNEVLMVIRKKGTWKKKLLNHRRRHKSINR